MFYWDLLRKKGFIVTLLLVLSVHQSTSKTKRSKKGECARGCEVCDPVNGCIKCRSKAFLYVGHNPDRNRETGSCVHRCPMGFLGERFKAGNLCKRCEQTNCNSCFHVNYCTRCAEGYLLHEAACVKQCPNGMGPDTGKKSCVVKVDCAVSAWTSWTPCARRSNKKSCKYGRKRRTRIVVKEPSENGKQCPKLKESKRCKTPSNKCIMVNRLYQRQLRRSNRKQRKTAENNKKLRRHKNRRHEINNNDTMPSKSSRNKHDKAT